MATAFAELKHVSGSGESLFSSQRHRKIIVSLLLVLFTLLIYNPVVHNGFVSFDDPGYLTTNRHIHSGLTWDTVKWAFSSTSQANWHPLTWISHALDWQLFGDKPAGHHYVNVLLHAICTILLFLFFENTTRQVWKSAVLAALFAAHPMNVESVAWVSERKNVLCTVFFLLALLAYRTYAYQPSVKRYLLVAFWFALGLMSKPMVITLPFVLLLLDYWPLGRMNFSGDISHGPSAEINGIPAPPKRSFAQLILEKLPLFVLVAGSAAITMVAQKGGGAMRYEVSSRARVMNALVSYARYVGKAFWPTNLSPMYPHPGNAIPVWEVIAASLFLLAITWIALKFSQHRYFIVGWLWFLGTLIPVIGLVQVGDQAMADRYAYLPYIGLFVMAVWGIADWARERRIPNVFLVAAVVVMLPALAIATHKQIGYWHDSMTLWSHTLEVTKNNYIAHDNIGVALLEEGRLQEAKAHFQAAIDINPRDAFSQLNIGVCEKDEGDTKDAIKHYQSALELSSDPTLRSVTLGDLAVIYRRDRDYRQAQSTYAQALELDPENVFALTGMGLTMQKIGNLPSATDYYAKATEVSPSDVGYLLLAQSLEKIGQHEQAQAALTEAAKISENFDVARQTVQATLQ
jgi:tetratricopeptide (TPR) repeat protein/ABC-type maltose transport system permease subunit